MCVHRCLTVKGKPELSVSPFLADSNRVRSLAGFQVDLVALCKYLPLDGDRDHYTGIEGVSTVKKIIQCGVFLY